MTGTAEQPLTTSGPYVSSASKRGFKLTSSADDAFSRVPYEKGSNFLLHLERTVGGLDVFMPYIKEYVKTYNGYSITTDQWRSHLFDYFGKVENSQEILKNLGKLDWDAVGPLYPIFRLKLIHQWLHGDGPDLAVDVKYDDTLSKPVSNPRRSHWWS